MDERETRPYRIGEGAEAIIAIAGFQIIFTGERPEKPSEKRHADLLNGAVSNLCDNALQNLPGATRDRNLLPDIVNKRPRWIESLLKEAKDFLNPEYALYECTKTTGIAIGRIQASIRCIIERNQPDPRNDFAGTVWKLMSEHSEQAKRWRITHHVLTTISIIGSVAGTVAVGFVGVDGHRVVLVILLALPTIAFAVEKGFSVAANAQWNQNAMVAYSALRDEFYFSPMTVEQGVKLFNSVRKRLDQTRPVIGLIPAPASPEVQPPAHGAD